MFLRLFKVAAATLLYAGVHSLLASRPAKDAATRLLGERRRNGLYRPFFNVQAVAGLLILVVYISRQPSRDLWRVCGLARWLMHTGQAGAVLYLLWGVTCIGWGRFLGTPGLAAYWNGLLHVPREPESQAAILGAEGKMRAVGPFRTSRNAINFAIIPMFWLSPRMTDTFALFNALVTLYLVVGSYHSEARMRQLYGKPMEDYQNSGVSFFIPSLTRLLPEGNA